MPPTCGWRPSAASSGSAPTPSTCCCCTTPTAPATAARRSGTGLAALRDAGLTRALGVAPGPANGFTLDLIACFERFGEQIDWAMVILNPLEPWPGELVLPAAERHGIRVITRVVDYGGLFHDDVLPGHAFARHDHRTFRPDGWIEAGRERLERMRPIAERHGITPLQLACAWNLAHPAVHCVAPTLIQEPGRDAKPIEAKRAELAAVPGLPALSADEVAADPSDRRQHRLHAAEGRRPGPRGRRAGRPLADLRGPGRGGRALGDRAGARPAPARGRLISRPRAGSPALPDPGRRGRLRPPSAVRRESTSPPSGFVRVP